MVDEGRKWLRYIILDAGGLTIKRAPKSERKHMRPLDYNLNTAKRKFRAAGRKFGITKAAKQLLRG
jgi:hypothetical protein